MKGTWIAQCNEIARQVKNRPGQLIGCAVDNDEKADAFVKYWSDKHDHIEIVDRKTLPVGMGILIRLRLKGQVQ